MRQLYSCLFAFMISLFYTLLLSAMSFISPVHYDIALAGNFGEPRPNHFHGGIDIKTGQVEGKALYAVADGYVSRVTVGLFGFGNAVYIQHPTGQTSVYCHLKKFSPRIAAAVKRWQYEHRSYAVDVRLKPTDVPVSQGSFIAFSGNTGASQAPHLHLEIHDTRTWNMLDPLDFLSAYVKDGFKPLAHGFMAYPKEGEGTFCNGTSKQSFAFTATNLTRKFTAWGKVGFGIWANDYMEATYNRYGIRDTRLVVDGKTVFHSNVNDIPVEFNRMVNSWGDYEHYMRYNVWYMKSFVEPGNLLPILHVNDNQGYITFNEERDYHIDYVVTDFKGNSRTYTFIVTGKKTTFWKKKAYHPFTTLAYDRMNYFSLPGMKLWVRPGLLADNLLITPSVKIYKNQLSDSYQFVKNSYPLFDWAEIAIKLRKSVKDNSKLYIVSHWGKERFMGGIYQNGWVKGKVRELAATYEIAYDDLPPTINPVNQSSWNARHRICIGLQDSGSGVASYKAFVDGTFVLFEEVPKSPWVACNLEETPLQRLGKIRTFKFIATDNRNNSRVFIAKIKY